MGEFHIKYLAGAVALLALPIVCLLGSADFHTRGEAREALVVQSMIKTHSYILPRGYGDTVASKPPLFHWLGAAAATLTGSLNEFTIRLPSAVFALLALAFFLLSLRKELDGTEACLFLLILPFSFEWLRASVSARVDMVHAASLASGLLAGYRYWNSGRTMWWLLTVYWLILSILAKGPVGAAIPGLVFGAFGLARIADARAIERLLDLVLAPLLALLLAGLWYLTAYKLSPDEFSWRVWYENAARFTSTMQDSPHQHSVFYLAGMFLVGLLPWSFVLLWLLRGRMLELVRSAIVRPVEITPLAMFAAISVAIMFAFYSVPSGKRGVYLLTAYPFAALLLSMAGARVAAFNSRKIMACFVTAAALVSLVQGFVIPGFIAPLGSERRLGELLCESRFREHDLVSFGFEFYGASFYSGRKIERLEQFLSRHSNQSAQEHLALVVHFDSAGEKLEETARVHGLRLIPAAESAIGGQNVNLSYLTSTYEEAHKQ